MSADDLRGLSARVDRLDSHDESSQDRREPPWRLAGFRVGVVAASLTVPVVWIGQQAATRSVQLDTVSLEAVMVSDAPRRSIPLDVHPRVDKWLEAFRTTRRDEFAHLLIKKKRFDEVIQSNLRMRGMPEELVYIPMIESEYSPFAVSRVSAVGLWQFMSPTALQYGLRVDPYVDERRDPIRATDAALDYLDYLHNRFGGSWYLAAAAFNAGPGRLERVLNRRAEGKEWNDALFWEIVDYLPRETREYIPKMIAVTRLAKEAEAQREAVEFASYTVTPYRYDNIFVPGGTTLQSVADALDANSELLVALNPHLTQRMTPPGEMYGIRVPVGSGAVAVAMLSLDLPARRADD